MTAERTATVRAKHLYRVVDERAGVHRPPLLAVSIHHGVVPRSSLTDDEPRADDLSAYKRCDAGDIVLNRMRAFQGAIGIAPMAGLVSPDYLVLRPRPTASARYLHHLFRSKWFVSEMATRLRGIGSVDQGNVRTPRINADDLGDIDIALPGVQEQEAIADFLDRETARIDALVAVKRRMVEILDERRRNFIAHAVTHGQWGTQDLRQTGSEFAPLIPQHWKLVRLKNVVRQIVDTAHKTAPEVPGGEFLIVRTSNVKSGQLVLNDAKYTNMAGFDEWTERATPRPGDIMFTREAPAGEACLVPEGIPLCIGQRMVLIQTDRSRMLPEFGLHSLYGGAAQEFVRLLSRSTTVAHLNMADIPNIPIALPPIDEQRELVGSITRDTESVLGVTGPLSRQIELLVEHRQALITAAVTGQMTVAGVAA